MQHDHRDGHRPQRVELLEAIFGRSSTQGVAMPPSFPNSLDCAGPGPGLALFIGFESNAGL